MSKFCGKMTIANLIYGIGIICGVIGNIWGENWTALLWVFVAFSQWVYAMILESRIKQLINEN